MTTGSYIRIAVFLAFKLSHTHTQVIFSAVIALLCSLIRFPLLSAVISYSHGSPGGEILCDLLSNDRNSAA